MPALPDLSLFHQRERVEEVLRRLMGLLAGS